MISRSVAVVLLAVGCVTAAAGGSYLAVRENAASAAALDQAAPAPAAPADHVTPVTETETIITPETPATVPAQPQATAVAPLVPAAVERAAPVARPAAPRRVERPAAQRPEAVAAVAEPAVERPAAPEVVTGASEMIPGNSASDRTAPEPVPAESAPARAPEPAFEEIVVPSSAVIGLEVERTITSEQAHVEDRVDARVTRDVHADGRVAIPAGSRVLGNVTLVERGGKMKDRARLGVRFHTVVLADGRQVAIRTDTIYREGDSPGAESSRKIGGAAIGGAVLGAILGGGKGAVAGAAAGAAGGTAAVMAGGRNAATIAAGSIVNARLSAPVTVEIER